MRLRERLCAPNELSVEDKDLGSIYKRLQSCLGAGDHSLLNGAKRKVQSVPVQCGDDSSSVGHPHRMFDELQRA